MFNTTKVKFDKETTVSASRQLIKSSFHMNLYPPTVLTAQGVMSLLSKCKTVNKSLSERVKITPKKQKLR